MALQCTVELNKDSENISRAARRLIVNTEFLKAAKLCTGDVVVLSNGDMSRTVRSLFTDFYTANLYLTAHICGGRRVALA
jgi:hypothetical protein